MMQDQVEAGSHTPINGNRGTISAVGGSSMFQQHHKEIKNQK